MELCLRKVSSLHFTDAGLLSIPVMSASVESAIISLLALLSHSSVNSCSAVCFTSRTPITYNTQKMPDQQLSTRSTQEGNALTRIVRQPSWIPSSTLPYIPSRCHLTSSQPTPMTILCRCVTIQVESPAKSRKSRGSRRVYE